MPSVCSTLKAEYESLQTLTKAFVASCDTVKGSGSFDTLTKPQLRSLQRKKQALEQARDALKEKLVIIHVQQAINPYREAFLASGIPDIDKDSLSAERRDMTWNLKDVLKHNQATYRSMGLTAWAENIATMRLRLTPDMRRTLKQEIKDGAIPIIMPDRETQLNTTVEQFRTAFKPTWIKNGKEQTVNDAYLECDHFKDLITIKAEALVEGVPDHPYISMMKPTQRPDEHTTNQTVDEQLDTFTDINTERVVNRKQEANILNPHEYGALQTIHSRHLKEHLSGQPTAPTTLNPIDTETWIRFINLPQDSEGDISDAYWDPGDRQLSFTRDDADDGHVRGGFRLAVRVGGIKDLI